jgi:tRNA(Ile)-lysidine synthase
VPVKIGAADVRGRAERDHAGIEDAARRERYAFLRGVKDEVGARFIALGHTRDDQAETFLLRLLRGAGMDGLSSMRPVADDLLRPMLHVSRADVLDHLRERGLTWREDASNADAALLRNRVRHELLPYLESRFNPALRATLARSAELMADEAQALEADLDARGVELRRAGEHVTVSVSVLRTLPVAQSRRLLRRAFEEAGGLKGVSAGHIESVRTLALAPRPSGRRLPVPGGREALVSFGELRVGPAAPRAVAYAYPLPVPGRVALPNGLALSAEAARGPAVSDTASAVIPLTGGGLTVRTRRPGDRVTVGGHDVSLKRFLMSRHVPATDRAGLPLVASGERILWIPGLPAAPACNEGAHVRVRLEMGA